VGQQAREVDVGGAAQLLDGHRPPLEVADRPDTVGAEQLEAADVGAREHDDRIARFDLKDDWPREVHREVRLAGRHGQAVPLGTGLVDVLELREALVADEVLGDVQGGLAHARRLDQPQPRRLEPRARLRGR
jgi:hypothetical protein